MDYSRSDIEGAVREGGYTLAGLAFLALQKAAVTVRDLEKKAPKLLSEQVGRSGRALFEQLGLLRSR